MSSATTHSSAAPTPPFPDSPRPIPTLDQLQEMTAVPEERVVIADVDWAFYQQLVDSIPAGVNIHADYDGKDVEIMSLGPFHDGVKTRLGRFVELTSEELEVSCTGLGSTTWKRPEVVRGVEADECYYFSPQKLAAVAEAMARLSDNVAEYPNPDLALEVNISPSKIDRPGIYAALRVAEIWRYDGKRRPIAIERLADDGTYRPAEESAFLPVRPDEIGRWVLSEDSRDGSRWARQLASGPELSWLRAYRGESATAPTGHRMSPFDSYCNSDRHRDSAR